MTTEVSANSSSIGLRAVFAAVLFLSGTGMALNSTAEELPKTTRRVEGLTIPKLEVRQDENRLYFVLSDQEERPTTIRFPRLANVVLGIRWLNEKDSTMQVKSEPTEWAIDLSRKPDNSPAVVVLELDAPVTLFNKSVVGHADSDTHIVLLPAKLATTHGSKLRFEPQPHKNTVGYWADEKDTAEWTFQYDKPGVYDIDILQGCGKGHGGSSVKLQVGEQSLDFVVEETGHFQNFIWRTVGSVTLSADDAGKKIALKLVPQKKQAGAVMDVRAIRLCPRGSQRSFEPELADPKSLPQKPDVTQR